MLSARAIASIFGACSPRITCRKVTIVKAIAIEIADRDRVRRGCRRAARAAPPAPARRGSRCPSEASVIPTWQVATYSSTWSICSSASRGAGFALVAQLLEPAAARAHDRELGRDEEAVDRDQQQQEDEQEDAHRLCGPVLRAGTSSAIRRTQYSWPPPQASFDRCDIGRMMRVATLSEMLEEVVRLGEATGMEDHAHECAASSRAGWRRCGRPSPGRRARG